MKKLLLFLLLPTLFKGQNFCIRTYDQSIIQGLSAKINFVFCDWKGFGACDSMVIRLENDFISGNRLADRYSFYPLVTDSANLACSSWNLDSTCQLIYTVPFTAPSGGRNYYFELWKNGAFQLNETVSVNITASAFSISQPHRPEDLVRTEYYTITGTRIDAPAPGLTIVLRYFSDGSVERKKQFIVKD